MRIVDGMILRQVGAGWVAVPTGDASERLHGVVRLNSTGKVVWDAFVDGATEEEAAARLTERYEVDEEHALESVRKVVAKLTAANLLA